MKQGIGFRETNCGKGASAMQPTHTMLPLTKEEIDEFAQGCALIFSLGGGPPMPYLDRLLYTAKLGAEFVKQTSSTYPK